jgi:phytoene synthase
MVDESQLERSKSIHRRTGRTFYFATRLLPQQFRRPTYVLYAFFRIADEVVDGEAARSRSATEKRERLERIREAALGRADAGEVDPVLAAFAELREEVDIPEREVDEFVDAMVADIETARYDTYEELEAYMRGSAAAVGEMMVAVMDPDEADTARPHARALGEAFQLTNFVRDVREDIDDRGRVYLPMTTLEANDVTVDQLRAGRIDDAFRAAVEDELRRAEGLYREGVAGIRYLPEDAQFAVLLAAVLYADHHRLIRERDNDVLTETPSLSTARKTWLVLRTRWHWLWNKDPEAVFAAVSPVPTGATGHPGPGRGDPQPMR